jgi:putative heme-binding domain-containing protein
MRHILLVLVLLSLPLGAQHDEKDKKTKHPAFGDPVAIAAGSKLFAGSCAGCHGPRGEGGRGPNLRNRGAWHSLDETDLFQTIQNGIPGADMPGTKLPDEQIWQVAAFVRALGAPAIETRPPGDPAAGEALFWGSAGCGGCHRVLGRGGMLGPDLSNAGASRPADQLREAIVDPDADGFRGYRGVTATLKSGKAVEGVARDITNYSIAIRDKSGNIHLLPRTDIRELKMSDHSPMPQDYRQRLTREQIDNLVAYLSQRSIRPYSSSSDKKKP